MSANTPRQNRLDRWLNQLPALPRTRSACIGLIVIAGLALRIFGYLRNPSVWHDEAALILNVLGKNFSDLLGPLFFSEAAPPLFLWVERAVVLLLGDSTYALRLVPFLASCAALLLFVPVARRLLPSAAVPWALLLFAFNDHLLWHASEAKPYSLDVLAATVLLAVWVGTMGWALERRLLLYAGLAPVVIFLVYPGCFLLGGLMLALLPGLWEQRQRRAAWLAYGALTLSVAIAFLLLYIGPARAQRNSAIESCWSDAFPPWGQPWWSVPVWVIKSTLDALCYCVAPVGNVLVGVLIVGAIGLWRRSQHTTLVLLLSPAALALVASSIGGYPYAGTRLLVYLTPAVVILIAAGVPPTLTWLRRRSRLATAGVAGLVLAAVGLVAYNTAFPYGRPAIAEASRYVLKSRQPGDVVWGNAWEPCYYFRHLGDVYVSLDRNPTTYPPSRVWIIVIAATPREREGQLHLLTPEGWQWMQRRDFYRTTVLLLQSPAKP